MPRPRQQPPGQPLDGFRDAAGMFHKTTITLTVLSRDPIPAEMDIDQVLRETDEGGYVLQSVNMQHQEISPQQMSKELMAAGSDPSFMEAMD